MHDGIRDFQDVARRHHVNFAALVAETSLWANPEVHRRLFASDGVGAFFPNYRRARKGAGESPGSTVAGETLDSNVYAVYAIRRMTGASPKAYQACHIWPQSCYDARCHTVLANLILVPSPLAGLSDHDPETKDALVFRSFELYGWLPPGQVPPTRPANYPTTWREPAALSRRVENALRRRLRMPAETAALRVTAARRRYDLQVGEQRFSSLSKGRAILRLVHEIVSRGVHPDRVTEVMQERPNRVWRDVPSVVDAATFVGLSPRGNYDGPFVAGRWFVGDGELIIHAGRTYAFTNQWGSPNWDRVMERLAIGFPDLRISCAPVTGQTTT
ncbi:MAG: hypothetical protein AB7Q17_02865 [Phycisphaerae bacterium]